MYTPKPLDTSNINLPLELEPLIDQLARNVHENWAATRIAQGWVHGPKRDDIDKKHPCLVPYDDLAEDEKEYDRMLSVQTIRAIIQMGFIIIQR